MKLAVTAGFDGSKPAIALCELLTCIGHEVDTVVTVTPYSIKRLRQLLLQRGVSGIRQALDKLMSSSLSPTTVSPMAEFLLQNSITCRSLKAWCQKSGAIYRVVENINAVASIDAIKECSPDALIYAGGGILRGPFIEAANRSIVNPHSGPLPEIRGMNAMEWAILLDQEPAITIHMIDEGIDTGDILGKAKIHVAPGDSVSAIREKAVITGIKEIVRLFSGLNTLADLAREDNPGAIAGRQCYIMSPAINELLESRLADQ